jgi:hypothetical protein
MTTFTLFRETNDHEGESWTFWLQRDGNEDALLALGELIAADEAEATYDYPYKLDLTQTLPEKAVDLLCRYAEDGYYAAHNRVTGTLTIPASFDVDNHLYKGGIMELFE